MGKKIISLLLALMLLCGTAAAEGAYQLTLEWASVPEGTKLYLQRTSDNSESKIDQLAGALSELAEKSNIRLNIQEDAVYFALSMMDTLLLDMGIYVQENETIMTSTLMPGRYVLISDTIEAEVTDPATWLKVEEVDLDAVLAECLQTFLVWCSDIPGTEEHGNFVGDAYTGGTHCRSFTFDDADVAKLLDQLLDVLDKHGIDDAALEEITSSAPIATLRVKNREAAEANRFTYRLSLVTDDINRSVGASLLVMEGDKQVMTFSLATADNGIRLVCGYGMNDQNHYIEAILIDDGATQEEFAAAYSLTVYEDPYRLGFGAVEGYIDYVMLSMNGSLRVVPGEAETTWFANAQLLDPASPNAESCYELTGAYQHEQKTSEQVLSWSIYSDEQEKILCETYTLRMEPCDSLVASTEGLTCLNMEDDGANLTDLDMALEEGAMEFAVQLFKLLPAPLLTYLMY